MMPWKSIVSSVIGSSSSGYHVQGQRSFPSVLVASKQWASQAKIHLTAKSRREYSYLPGTQYRSYFRRSDEPFFLSTYIPTCFVSSTSVPLLTSPLYKTLFNPSLYNVTTRVPLLGERSLTTLSRPLSSLSRKPSPLLNSVQYIVKGTVCKLQEASIQSGKLLVAIGSTLIHAIFHPAVVLEWWAKLKDGVVHGIQWTKRGFKMFGANFKVSLLLAKKKMKGQPLSYREHKLLIRTTSDLVKLIPFSFFVVVPFAELLLPVALWLFPGMLPSTFSERQVDNPHLQRKLKAKQELAQFFQELVAERTRQVLDEGSCDRSKDRARLLKEFQEKLILKAKQEASEAATTNGENSSLTGSHGDVVEVNPFLSLKETLTYAKLFREEFKLEKMPTSALLVLCEILGIRPYRIRANVILQLRYHILRLQEEDREILWEGVDSLSHEELRDACRERAMRFYGVSDDVMRDQMSQWLALSSHRDIPPLLLLWSRSITMTHGMPAKTPIAASLNTDELLPVIDTEADRIEAEKVLLKEDQLKAEFHEIDRHLEQLQDTAEVLEQEQKNAIAHMTSAAASGVISDSSDATMLDSISTVDAAVGQDSEAFRGKGERARASREVLLRKKERLEKEMQLLRNVSDLQHEYANLIDEYRTDNKQGRQRPTKTLADFVNRLETTVLTFEQGAKTISNMLETAKCLRLGWEDDSFYPAEGSDSDTESSYSEPLTIMKSPSTLLSTPQHGQASAAMDSSVVKPSPSTTMQ